MPIVGNLSEFPLPEVLLLIGRRTGRLRLLDVPEFGVLDVDISGGEIQAVRTGTSSFIDARDLLDKLSTAMQAQDGMFEFRACPIPLVTHAGGLNIHELAMKLVCHVDEQAARQQAAHTGAQLFRLVEPPPEIWIEPGLNVFFETAQPYLAAGTSADALAAQFQWDPAIVHQCLGHLHLLGLAEPVPTETALPITEELERTEQIARTSRLFLQAGQAAEKIRKISSGPTG